MYHLYEKYTSIFLDLTLYQKSEFMTQFSLLTKNMHLTLPSRLYKKLEIAKN